MSTNLDDLLGPSLPKKMAPLGDGLDDLLGYASPPAPKKAKRVRKRSVVGVRAYKPLPTPKEALAGGIFDLKETKGRNLGRTCLNPDCKKELRHSKGRPPILCGKKACYRFYRNAYRKEYDRVRPS